VSGSRNIMEHPLRTLLYEVFVEPILRFLHWPVTKRVEGHVEGVELVPPR
jgi:hypothetical protein